MPVLSDSAYSNVETILQKARVILNDAEVLQGDVLTDTYAGMPALVNLAYEQVQRKLAEAGVETFIGYAWLVGIPAMPTLDPEARIQITDTGFQIYYPSGVGNSQGTTPQLPQDLICPLKLWERQTGTSNYATEMAQKNDGIPSYVQQTFLWHWEWHSGYFGNYGLDALIFRGAQQVQDVKLKYERHLSDISAVTDPVPIRGVDAAAAYYVAKIFAASRGSQLAPAFAGEGEKEIEMLQNIAARRAQRKKIRRRPYSGQWSRYGWPVM